MSNANTGANMSNVDTFRRLMHLVSIDRDAYLTEVRALRPEVFRAFVAHVHATLDPAAFLAHALEMVESNADERCTQEDVDHIVGELATRLGWSRERVLCEALHRFDADLERRAQRGQGIGRLHAYEDLPIEEQRARSRKELERAARKATRLLRSPVDA